MELDVRVEHPDATVGDLASVLHPGGCEAAGLRIDGRFAAADLTLPEAGLHDGATVALAAAPSVPAAQPEPAGPGGPALEVDVVGGLHAGGRFPLGSSEVVVGRDDACAVPLPSPTVSHRHAGLRLTADGAVEVQDLGSHNGTWLGPEPVTEPVRVHQGRAVRLGAVLVAVRPRAEDDRPLAVDPVRHLGPAGTLPFNRPPRDAPPPEPAVLPMPKPPGREPPKPGFNVIAAIAPLVLGVVLVVAFGNLLFGLFAFLSPVVIVGGWFEARRRNRRTTREERARFETELTAFRQGLEEASAQELDRRRSLLPDLAEVLRRAELPSRRLWERRPGDVDHLLLRAGTGDLHWDPPVDRRGAAASLAPAPEGGEQRIGDAIAANTTLAEAPVAVELAEGGVVGVVGDRGAALAFARSLVCQAAVHHGPADLAVAVCTTPAGEAAWDWAKWLPHTRDTGGATRLLSADTELSTALLQGMLDAARAGDQRRHQSVTAERSAATGRVLLAVLDDEALTRGRQSPGRSVLRGRAGPVAGIVLAATADQLPAVCTTVVELRGPDGEASLQRPQRGERVGSFLADGLDPDTARRCARALARFDDPELEIPGAGLPDRCRLLPLLDLRSVDAAGVRARWRAGGPDPAPAAPIGVGDDGVFTLDLVRDGPHGLVAGTTGSGKSELLRTLVAGMAVAADPDHLTFVLVDYKGGSAFDQCARLPHTVGMVTDLDEHLGARALRCLEAELRYRERRLRAAGAPDLPSFLRAGGDGQPLPRLLVVIDEFATLVAELPDFVDALVGVAQRGRSLGVHLLLATQRPQGAVRDNIRANTNLRIALRVQDGADSMDVVGTQDAAGIPRSRPGRAYVRLGPGELATVQTALSTATDQGAEPAPVEVAPFRFGPWPRVEAPVPTGGGTSDLARLVDAVGAAAEGMAPPRRPWPEPLPAVVAPDAVAAGAGRGLLGAGDAIAVALADDPDAQAQYPVGWRPEEGNLVLYGIVGSGTTTALAATVLARAASHGPDDLHVYALDSGGGGLAPLEVLPHVGAVVGATERERQIRLIRRLRAELARRQELDPRARAAEPRVVVLVDGWAALHAEFDDLAGSEVTSDLARVFSDGPELGITLAVAAERVGAMPLSLAGMAAQKLLFRLGDRHDYATFGVPAKAVPEDLPPGRALVAGTVQLVQVAWPGPLADAVAAVAARWPAATRPPAPVLTLPEAVPLAAVAADARIGRPGEPWFVPVGVSSTTLRPDGLVLYDAEHAVVTGPARSGKTVALRTLAAVVRTAAPDVAIIAVAGPRSALASAPGLDRVGPPAELADLLAPVLDDPRPHLVLVDDADTVEDDRQALASLLAAHRPDVHLVAAGRADGLRQLYNHWTRDVRRHKVGLLLQPADGDGDVVGTVLPRRAPVALTVGRGYLVHGGDVGLVQVAQP
ncbi:MAG: FHA domain-containing protein [Actinobacteria bacterium]|nr:FHA domain-containing protein [Actinomycetota bacterium]